jgi:hypothetical protein
VLPRGGVGAAGRYGESMAESSDQDLPRRRAAVEREMQRLRDGETREARELVDTVGDQQQRERERAADEGREE